MASKEKGVKFTVLVEDKALWRFVRGILIVFGFSKRAITCLPLPAGRGSAKQFVENEYSRQLQAHRSRNYQSNIVLVVGTDADEHTVKQRLKKLSDALAQDKLSDRKQTENIVLWIPKRNIETWLYDLDGNEADEETDYKRDVCKPDYKALGKEFVSRYHKFQNRDAQDLLPSLQTAFEETSDRLPSDN